MPLEAEKGTGCFSQPDLHCNPFLLTPPRNSSLSPFSLLSQAWALSRSFTWAGGEVASTAENVSRMR
jgi:hypothetical protein